MRRGILVLAAGAGWESEALALLEGEARTVVLRRCVDVDDLLASVTLGQADGALVSLDAPGLDTDAVAQLGRAGVLVVAVAAGPSEAAQVRAQRIGIGLVLDDGALGRLPDLLAHGPTARQDERDHRAPGEEAPETLPPTAESSAQESTCRVLAVCGARGAPGASTVALATAATLAAAGERVTLIDADPLGGSLGQQLGVLDEVSGLLAVGRLAASGRIAEGWQNAARTVAPGWQVLTGVPRPDRWREVPEGALSTLVEAASGWGWVVVDVGTDTRSEVLDLADEVVLVGLPDPVGLGRACRSLADLEEHGVSGVRVALNRWRDSLGTREEVEGVLRQVGAPTSVHLLPEDTAAADRALLAQRSVVQVVGSSALTHALLGLGHAQTPALTPAVRPRRAGAVALMPGLRRRTAGTSHRR
ncbi:hypothetical protein [Nocardioides sp.]|uniref:AAA family ATPase n=1 Tax=Nocardioides sp. TaxID=35761 RepID=UPI00262BA341|nr:hypothetical protein [Nocardioides sp.]